jgi:DNA-binding transcriptional LysR family regulator
MAENVKPAAAPRHGFLAFSNLRIFEAVARHNNFSRAAEELGVSQPYVSNQIAEFEQKLDLILFRRVGRRVYLTEAGNRLYAHARSLLSQLAVAEDSMAELRSKVLGRLESATTIIPAQHILPGFLEQLADSHPGLQVVLHICGSREVEAAVVNGRFELGITMSPEIPDELEGIEISRDELLVILSPQHRLAQKKTVRPEELTADTWIMREPTSGTRVFIESLFSQLGLPIRRGPELNNNEVIKSLVAAGIGVAILSTRAVAEDIQAGRLCALKLKDVDLSRPIRVVVRRSQSLTPAAETFRSLLLSFCSSVQPPHEPC